MAGKGMVHSKSRGRILAAMEDVLYPTAEKIVPVTDNLNTHTTASLYKAYHPQEARRPAERFEWHYTPKHGSRPDMAEIEIGVMSRQALAKPFGDPESFKRQIRTWTAKWNAACKKINRQFTTKDARIKLAKLYPEILKIGLFRTGVPAKFPNWRTRIAIGILLGAGAERVTQY